MTSLINADELKDWSEIVPLTDDGGIDINDFEEKLRTMPTIDAEPVRHGKWIDIDEQSYTWKVRCSCCGNERSMMSTQGEYPNYCENCGARMDEE